MSEENFKNTFDKIAKNYDDNFTFTLSGKFQRELVYDSIIEYITQKKKILELNCGTGEDAVRLARAGNSVTGIDISPVMIELANAKIRMYNQEAKVNLISGNLIDFVSENDLSEFDIVFSNFGGLNCISKQEFLELSKNLSSKLIKGSILILVMMSDFCLTESLHFFLKFNFRSAFKRIKKGETATIGVDEVPVHYFSPTEVSQIFSDAFKTKLIKPIGVLIPPSYLNSRLLHDEKKFYSFYNFEKKYLSSKIYARISDHFLIILEKF